MYLPETPEEYTLFALEHANNQRLLMSTYLNTGPPSHYNIRKCKFVMWLSKTAENFPELMCVTGDHTNWVAVKVAEVPIGVFDTTIKMPGPERQLFERFFRAIKPLTKVYHETTD